MKTKRQYFLNALLLTAVTLLMRTVSVSFNVYLSNRVGAEAMGLISLISGIYGFAVTLATSGIHLATVRIVTQAMERTAGAENKRALHECLRYATCFGTLAMVLLASFARPIGILALKDARTVKPLFLLSLTLPPIALTTVLNGYFTAVRRAWKNALSQVTEQGVKITLCCFFLVFFSSKSVEGCVLAILLGGAVAESFSLILNVILYLFDKRHFRHISPIKASKIPPVASIALPVAISAYMRSGLLAIEHILIPRGLLSFGAGNSAALAAYGSLHGMALPVVLYPAAILSSFSSLLIPEVTAQQAVDNKREIRYIAGRVYQMTLLFSIGVAGVLLGLSSELGEVLYHSKEVAAFIGMLAPLVPIMYLDTATDAMLKGLGQQVYSMNVNILDALISVIAVAILVPRMGILGCVVTIYITELLNAALSIVRLLSITGFSPSLSALILRPLLAVVGATSLTRLLGLVLPTALNGTPLGLTLHVLIAILLYMVLLLLVGGIARKDLIWLFRSLFSKKKKERCKNEFSPAPLCDKDGSAHSTRTNVA